MTSNKLLLSRKRKVEEFKKNHKFIHGFTQFMAEMLIGHRLRLFIIGIINFVFLYWLTGKPDTLAFIFMMPFLALDVEPKFAELVIRAYKAVGVIS